MTPAPHEAGRAAPATARDPGAAPRTVAIRRPIHRGSVLAAGLFADVRVLGEDRARARLLAEMGAGARVFREGDLLIAVLAEPARKIAETSPLGLLVKAGDVLSSAPLEADERAAIAPPDGHAAVIVQGGEARAVALEHAVDPGLWIDVSDFEVADEMAPLGRAARRPRAAAAALEADVRRSLGVSKEPPGAKAVREALGLLQAKESGSPAGRGSGPGPGRGAGGVFARLAASVLSAVSALLARLSGARRAGTSGDDTVRALAVREDTRPPGRSWLSALERAARTLALRLLVWSGMAARIGRRQAEYLSRMLDMFERGDLDAALRHAIPLGGGTGEPAPPALGTPSPRSDLSIVPAQGRRRSGMYSGPHLFEELRRRYRAAFDALVKLGQIEKAAFVLAELLGANEEAVSFLEKHGRHRLAAEIAEARRLPDGLVVRQWFLAGNPRRAIAIARARGAFADGVHRLEAAGQREQAAALRIAWADSLARAGQYAAAVTAIWPVEAARHIAGRWLDLAIEVGGPSGMSMAVRKARLFPDRFPEARDQVLALLQQEGEDGLSLARVLGAEISSHPEEEVCRTLARPALRALLRSSEPADVALSERLATRSCDATLAADHRLLGKQRRGRAAGDVRVLAAGATRGRHLGMHNEDGFVIETLARDARGRAASEIEARVAEEGIVLGVFDGMGGYSGGDVAVEVVRAAALEHLRATFRSNDPGRRETSLAEALEAANLALVRRTTAERELTGAGATAAVATVHERDLLVAHVGDCRAYLLRGGALTRLTRDHTLINDYLLLHPQPTPEELAKLPSSVVTRAIGVRPEMNVETGSVHLCDGDTLLLCTDGIYDWVQEERIQAILRRGGGLAGLCEALLDEVDPSEARDDRTVVIARFSGSKLPEVEPVRVTPVARAAAGPIPLRSREEPVAIHRVAADTGAIPISDAAVLPDGRIVAAVGELGTWLLSREGRVETRFSEPAHALVISDQGDRALALAERGESTRITRLDLARRRRQLWCDARLSLRAQTFDGSIWYVAAGDTLYAIDATTDGWEHLFQVTEAGARFIDLGRDETRLHVMLELGAGRRHIWKYDLPTHRLRSRQEREGGERPQAWANEMSPWAAFYVTGSRDHAGVTVTVHDAAEGKPRARVELVGAQHASGRVCGERLVVWDDRGRLLVISLESGAVLREVRLS